MTWVSFLQIHSKVIDIDVIGACTLIFDQLEPGPENLTYFREIHDRNNQFF